MPLIFGEVGPMVPEAFKKDREQMLPERPFNYEQMKAAIRPAAWPRCRRRRREG